LKSRFTHFRKNADGSHPLPARIFPTS